MFILMLQVLLTELNKSRAGFLNQKEKEWISAEPKDAPEEELQELLEEQPIYEQERYMIKMFMLHGHKPIEGYPNVATYLLHQMNEKSLHFEQEATRMLLNEIQYMLQEQIPLSPQAFINHSNPLISSTAASILVSKYEMSNRWVSKYDITIETPDELMPKDLESAILYMQKHTLAKSMKIAEEELKKVIELGEENEINVAIAVINLVKEQQADLARNAGIVILH